MLRPHWRTGATRHDHTHSLARFGQDVVYGRRGGEGWPFSLLLDSIVSSPCKSSFGVFRRLFLKKNYGNWGFGGCIVLEVLLQFWSVWSCGMAR